MADDVMSDHGRSSDINIVEIESGEIRQLSSNPGTWGVPSISPDGKLVAYAGGTDTPANFPPVELRVVGIDGETDRTLLRNMPASIGNTFWDDGGRGVYLTLQKEGSDNVHYVALNGDVRDVTSGVQRVRLASRSKDALYGVVSSAHGTGNVARINARNGKLVEQTAVNADVLADVELGEVEEIWYDSTDETRVQGWIVKPPGFDPKQSYPLVLHIHGGPNAMYGVNFSFRFQEFAARGYVVLYTNPRGSTGYDYDFVNAINFKYPGRADFDDLMAGVDAILDKGYVDEDRLYATGCSGGGVLTAWLVTHTDRFAAAASLCPVINWISQAGNADITRWSMERFDVPFWEDPTKWLEHSPLMHVANVTTPTLLMTGIEDLRTPLGQAEEFYAALKYLGVPTVLIPMHEEFHGTTSKPSNLLRTQLYLQAWFERFGEGGEESSENAD
jgi:dipeptidyl aminopeptidase/acylaminoacyl peptidase